jgi:hypothetical protein
MTANDRPDVGPATRVAYQGNHPSPNAPRANVGAEPTAPAPELSSVPFDAQLNYVRIQAASYSNPK